MSDRKLFSSGMIVRSEHLNGAFDDAEEGERRTLRDLQYVGVLSGLEVSETSPPSMAVKVAAGLARSKLGSRLLVPSDREVDLTQTEDGDFTEPAFGNERYVAVFLRPARDASDPKGPDLNGDLVFFEQDESYELAVVNGAEAAAGTAAPVDPDADDVLLCQVLVSNGMTEVLEADVDREGEEVAIALDGEASGFDLYRVQLVEALALLHGKLKDIILGAGAVDAAGVLLNGPQPTWASAANVTGTSGAGNNTVAKYLTGIVGDLAGTGALARVGAPAITVGSVTIPAGTALTHHTALASAANVNVGPSGVWGDGAYQSPAESVEVRVNGLIARLAEQTGAGGGARFVGMRQGATAGNFDGLLTVQAWLLALAENAGATQNGAYRVALYGAGLGGGFAGVTDVYGALARLRRTNAGSDGASHVACQSTADLTAGDVRSQIDALAAGWAKLARANEFTAAQTFSADTIVSGTGTLTVEGPSTFNGPITTEAAVVMNAATTLAGATEVSGALTVSGDADLQGVTTQTGPIIPSGTGAYMPKRIGTVPPISSYTIVGTVADRFMVGALSLGGVLCTLKSTDPVPPEGTEIEVIHPNDGTGNGVTFQRESLGEMASFPPDTHASARFLFVSGAWTLVGGLNVILGPSP